MATKWACLGPGRISHDFFLAMKDNLSPQEHECVAVASRDLPRAQKFAEEFNFKRAYGSYDEVARDEEIEVVYIGTISPNHVELSIKMLEAGKHVLCEKPMAMQLKDAKIVFETARKNKRVFIEGLWAKFTPAYEQIGKVLSAGTLGDIRLVQANLCVKIPANPTTGAGGLLDIGIYPVLLACMVFKEMPEQILASGIMTDNKGMDIGGCVILKYKNGGMANLVYHTDVDTFSSSAYIMGTKGAIEIPELFFCPAKITTPTGTQEFPLKPGNYNFPQSAGLQYEAKAMRETITSGKLDNDVHSMADSEMVLKIAEEVRRQIGVVCPDK